MLRFLATTLGALALLVVIVVSAGAASAWADVVPSGGDFQSVPPTWTAGAQAGDPATVSAAQASEGSNRYYRTQYTTPANLLGGGLLGMAATEGITSPDFTWSQASPQTLTASFDRRAAFSGLLGVDATAGIGMYLQNRTTSTETLLASNRITANSSSFSTVSATVSPALLINGDTYRIQVRETFAPTVQVAGGATIDLDNVGLTATPAVPPAPVLTAGSASISGVSSTGATASATIDPGAADTTVRVDYGTTTGYGSTVTQTIAANSGATTVQIPISGLTPSTGYHAQISASNAGGQVSSGDLTFTTSAQPSGPTAPMIGSSSTQGAVGEHTATIGTTVDDGGQGSTYSLQYGTSTAYGSSTSPQTLAAGTSGATTVAMPLSSLQPGTTYHARFVATSQGGTSYGSDVQFTTAPLSPPAFGTPAPSAATTSTDGTQETISAVVDPGSHDTQVSIAYGATASYGSTTSTVLVAAGSGATTVQIPISGLTPGNAYHYQVTAANEDGTVRSSDATFTPTAQTSPPVGTTSATAGPDEHSVTLGSTIDTGGSGGGYYLQYGTDTTYASQTASQNLTATSGNQPLSASLSGLAPGTTYHARFVATVNGHPTSYGADYQFTTAASSPPTFASTPTAATSDSGGDQETVSATVNPGAHDTQVSVAYGTTSAYGSTSSTVSVPAGSGATSVQISLSNLNPGTTYHYQVTATNADGTVSTNDSTFTPASSTSPPVGMTTTTSGPGESSVGLAATIDSGGDGGTYVLQYGTDTIYGNQTATQNLTATGASQPLTASLSGLVPGTTYHARFVAMVDGHPTSYGADYQFTTTAPPAFTSTPTTAPSDSAGDQQTVSATVDPGGLDTQVSVSYGTSSAYGSTSPATSVPATGGTATVQIPLSGLTPGTTYHFSVTAANADGTVSTTDATFVPSAQSSPPVGATNATNGPDEHSVTLGAAIDAGGSGGTYELQWGTDSSYGSQTATQALTATSGSQPLSASLSGLTPGTTYHARFVATVNGHPTSYGADYQFTTAAASPPAFTASPTATTADNAGDQETISATIDPGAHDTQVSIGYGTTTAYPNTSSTVPISAGSGPTVKQITITGLTPGTTYHYQVTATNGDGTVHSTDATFTPIAQTHPPVGATSSPGGPGPASVTFDSTIDTGGNGGTYHVQYGTDTTYGSQTATEILSATSGAQQLASTLSGLVPGTTYHARFVVAVDGHAGFSYGQDYTFTTMPAIDEHSFTNVGAQSSNAQVMVENGTHDASVYAVYGTTAGYGSQTGPVTVPAGPGATAVTLPLTGLAPGTTYHVQFVITAAGNTVRSADYTFTTAAPASGGVPATTTATTTTTTAPTTTPTSGPGSGPSCVAAYVSASPRTLGLLSVAAGSQVTAHRGLHVAITRRAAAAGAVGGAATFLLAGGRRTAIAHGGFTIALGQLRIGHPTTVHVVIPRGHHRRAMKPALRIDVLACGVQLTSSRAGRASLLTLRLPVAARRVSFTLPRQLASPRVISLMSPTGTRSLALAGSGSALHLRRAAGALRVTGSGSAITVSGLTRTTTGVVLRFAHSAHGTATARVLQTFGGPRTARVRLGRATSR